MAVGFCRGRVVLLAGMSSAPSSSVHLRIGVSHGGLWLLLGVGLRVACVQRLLAMLLVSVA
jgi:chloramphenicol 3-O-phosphotransferase